ncbi:MFS transporter [Nocardioides zeae]|uniref:MFS transporter n=1 Tax=Nocardioides imazamoxiresistens TaxID=3231893 RepID=A0ABU3PVZ9_9ACTN|nr:MFS transporter [Nocardioides zeae]MDT9593374.1 MFS transporter [Nocardioides zeae]
MTAPAHEQISASRRWAMLAAGTGAQTASAAMVHGPAFLIPALHLQQGLPLARAGLVAAAPLAGIMVALIAWGLVVDRRGERFALVAGQSLAVLGGLAATQSEGLVALSAALFVAGVGGAATNSASGRVVVGWFPPERRGLAMGVRQTGQPLGVGIAAASVAVVAQQHGVAAALWVPTAVTIVSLVVVVLVVLDPPRPPAAERASTPSPYRGSFLTRVHGVSVLLVVPQFVVWTYALTWMVTDLGWSTAAAGAVVAGTQVAGAAARVGAGWVSDLVGSRMRPLRWVAVAAAVTMVTLGVAAELAPLVAVVLMVAASAITVADNGLAFTAIAERAGPFWSGRALGIQNTAQNLVAAAVPPVAGLLVAAAGYPVTYALVGLLPLIAVALVPVAAEHDPAAGQRPVAAGGRPGVL